MKSIVLAMAMGVAVTGFVVIDTASAERKAKESYAACKSRISKVPPCSSNWTRWCVAQCGGR